MPSRLVVALADPPATSAPSALSQGPPRNQSWAEVAADHGTMQKQTVTANIKRFQDLEMDLMQVHLPTAKCPGCGVTGLRFQRRTAQVQFKDISYIRVQCSCGRTTTMKKALESLEDKTPLQQWQLAHTKCLTTIKKANTTVQGPAQKKAQPTSANITQQSQSSKPMAQLSLGESIT